MKINQLLIPLLNFLIGYRRTVLGPVWLLLGPALFIAILGMLFAKIGKADPAVFIPHLAIGLITWTLMSELIIGSTTVFQRARSQIMQGGQTLDDISTISIMTSVLTFLHQVPIMIFVFLIYGVSLSFYALISLIGLGLIIANGIWVTRAFGILGARYRDLAEVFQAVMRIAFLATPILWMPGEGGRSGMIGAFLLLNPFYHFLEIFRGPLLNEAIEPLSWAVVIMITIAGFAIARLLNERYARYVPLWV